MQMNPVAHLNNIVRIGFVSSVDIPKNQARVTFRDMQDEKGNPLVSGWLKIMQTAGTWIPEIDQLVICLYLPMGESDGFVIGGI